MANNEIVIASMLLTMTTTRVPNRVPNILDSYGNRLPNILDSRGIGSILRHLDTLAIIANVIAVRLVVRSISTSSEAFILNLQERLKGKAN